MVSEISRRKDVSRRELVCPMMRSQLYWLFKESREDFARYVFPKITPGMPDQYQLDFLINDNPEVILNWCRQSGKTTSAAVKMVHAAIIKPHQQIVIASATQKQAGLLQAKVTQAIHLLQGTNPRWRTQKKVSVPEDPLDENSQIIRCSVLSLELANGSIIVSVPAHEGSIRGYSPQYLILDEASHIPDNVYFAARPLVIRTRGQLIIMSTPAGKRGFFYETWKLDDSSLWKSAIDARQCAYLTEEELNKERKRYSGRPLWFEQEYFLRFLEPEGALFSEELVKSMFVPAEKAPVRALKPALVVPGKAYPKGDKYERPQRFIPRIGYG